MAEPAGIPEKFVVKDAAGQVDHAATALKIAQAYTPLEKRLGAGDAPPQAPDGYKLQVPEALAGKVDAKALEADPKTAEFFKQAHALGLNQKQVDFVMGEFLGRLVDVQQRRPSMSAAECVAQLRDADGWRTDGEYQQQVRLAYQAGEAYFGKDFDGVLADYGNDPRLVRALASIGKELQEDRPAPAEAQQQIAENIDTLMASPAYLNRNDPAHSSTVAKVMALQAQRVGQRASSGRSYTFASA